MSTMVVDGDGTALADGLKAGSAAGVAQAWADRLGAPMWLTSSEDDGDDGQRFDPAPQAQK